MEEKNRSLRECDNRKKEKKSRRDLKLEKIGPTIAGFGGDGKGAMGNVCGWPLEAGNDPQMGKEIEKRRPSILQYKE